MPQSPNLGQSLAGLGRRDLVLLALLTISWGVNWPVMKIGVGDLPPMAFRTLSMLGGLPVLWLIVRVSGQSLYVAPEARPEALKLAFFNMVLWFVFAMYGVKLLTSGRAAILGYTMPVWTALIGIAVFGEHPGRRLWIGVAAAAVGVLLLLSSEFSAISGSPAGTLMMLTAAIAWGYGTQLMRRRKAAIGVLVLTFWSLVMSAIVCGTLALLFEVREIVRMPGWPAWAAIGYNAVVIFGFSQVMWFRLATILPPVASGLSVMLIPVIGVFSGMAMLGEEPHWQDYAALVCILVAMATVLLPSRASAVNDKSPRTVREG